MLILEGPDLAGKTTLANALLKRLWDNPRRYGPWPAVYEHFSRLPKSWGFPKSYLPFIKRYSIMDRFHVSELCYGRACRGSTNLTPQMVRFLDAQLALVGSMTVVITLEPQFLSDQWDAKAGREEMFNKDQVIRVNEEYKQLGSYNPELRVDSYYEVAKPEDYLSTNEGNLDEILNEWTCRLAYMMSLYGSLYESPTREVNEVCEVLRRPIDLVNVQAC